MKMFSKGYYFDALNRLKRLTLVCSIVLGLLALLPAIPYIIEMLQVINETGPRNLTIVTPVASNTFLGKFIGIFVPFCTVSCFSHLMHRSDSDFYEAIPVTKRQALFSGALAVTTVSLLITTIYILISILSFLPCNGITVKIQFSNLPVEFLTVFLTTLLAVAGTLIAVSLTGTTTGAMSCAMVILYLPRLAMAIFNQILKETNPTLINGHIIPFFDNEYNLLTAIFTNSESVNLDIWAYLYTLGLIVIFCVVADILFSKRKSEFATHHFANSVAYHSFKIAICLILFLFALIFKALSFGIDVLFVFLIICSITFYFLLEFLIGKKDRNFKTALKVLPIFVGVCIIISASLTFTNLAFKSFSPEAEEIQSVSLLAENDETYITSFDNYVIIRSGEIELKDAETRDYVAQALNLDYTDDGVTPTAKFKIRTKNGVQYRNLFIKDEALYSIKYKQSQNDEYSQIWLELDYEPNSAYIYAYDLSLNQESANKVLESYQNEIKEIGFERWFDIYHNGQSNYDVSITYSADYNGNEINVSLPLFDELEKTLEVVETERKKTADNYLSQIQVLTQRAVMGKCDTIYLDIYNYSYYDGVYYQVEFSEDLYSNIETLNSLFDNLGTDFTDDEKDKIYIYCYDEDYSFVNLSFSMIIKHGKSYSDIKTILDKFK